MHTSCIPPKQTAIHPTATAPVLPGSLPQLLVAVLAAVLAPPAGSHGARSCPHGAHPVHPVSVGTAPPRRSFMHGHAGGHAIHHLLLSVDLMELVANIWYSFESVPHAMRLAPRAHARPTPALAKLVGPNDALHWYG